MFRVLFWLLWTALPTWCWPEPDRTRYKYRRSQCKRYQAKKRVVRSFWLVAGLAMLASPALPVIIVVTLFTTFVSFMYLDETG